MLYTHLHILEHEWRFLLRIRLKRVTHVQEAELWPWIGLTERLHSGQCAGLTDADHLLEGIFAEIGWCDADSPAVRAVLVVMCTHMSSQEEDFEAATRTRTICKRRHLQAPF